MTREPSRDEQRDDEDYRRRCAEDRLDRAREQASLITEFGGVRYIMELKDPALVPPDVSARQLRVYRGLLGLGGTDGD